MAKNLYSHLNILKVTSLNKRKTGLTHNYTLLRESKV